MRLTATVKVLSDDGGRDSVEVVATRDFDVPMVKANAVQGWATRAFRKALPDIRDDQVVRAEIKGDASDVDSHLVTGTMNGWHGRVQTTSGVFAT